MWIWWPDADTEQILYNAHTHTHPPTVAGRQWMLSAHGCSSSGVSVWFPHDESVISAGPCLLLCFPHRLTHPSNLWEGGRDGLCHCHNMGLVSTLHFLTEMGKMPRSSSLLSSPLLLPFHFSQIALFCLSPIISLQSSFLSLHFLSPWFWSLVLVMHYSRAPVLISEILHN